MKKLLLSLIKFYQGAISPYISAQCKYTPTCSVYATQAITKYGAAKGAFLALKRFLRCSPFFEGGYDPVP
ncbi:MAG: membrane protein insertion efficiency factor YidD [Christensenellaceae bacterium]